MTYKEWNLFFNAVLSLMTVSGFILCFAAAFLTADGITSKVVALGISGICLIMSGIVGLIFVRFGKGVKDDEEDFENIE